MTKCAPLGRLFLLTFVALFLAGCSQFGRSSLEDEKDPHFIEAKNRALALDWDGAIESFERALQSNPRNAAAHLELGILYDTKKNDYIDAIYHYKHHLMLNTNSPMADVVKQNMTACTRELVKTVSYTVLAQQVQSDLERFARTNAMLKDRVENLQAELARRPQYVTNYVTNFYGVPQFEKGSSSHLTSPAQPIASRDAEPEEEEQAAPPTRATKTPEPEPAPKQHAQTASRTRTREPAHASRASKEPEKRNEPPPKSRSTTHTVRPGETLAVLARKYGVSLKEMREANPGSARGVRAGQKIVIPK